MTNRKMHYNIIVLVVTLNLIGIGVLAATNDVNCDKVKYAFTEQGLSDDDSKENNDGMAMVCGEGMPCCTAAMQKQLGDHSKRQFRLALNQTLISVSSILGNRATKFDEFFREMLSQSKQGFHEMFKKTYGIIYEQNSYVFTDMFEELENYYKKGQIHLTEAMNEFFNTLYQKMFTVMNAQYNFDDNYLMCVSEHMHELKPFGDVPDKFSAQLRRSFVATRTFARGLSFAANVIIAMQAIPVSPSCNQAVAKMTHCPACKGLNDLKPCANYCTNVMKGCLAYHSIMDSYWNAFIDALDKVAERLLGPFNIEMVVDPIDIKISEAIMNFQENAHQVSQRVFSGCGKPMLGRKKRSADGPRPGELSFESLQFGGRNGKKKHQHQVDVEGKLEKVVKETRSRLRDTRHFFRQLPEQMCGTTAAPPQQDVCWNGHSQDKYTAPVVGDGINNQQNNPEVVVDPFKQNALINQQIFFLKTYTNKLKNAYNGHDVDIVPEYSDEAYGSGSGSGYSVPEDTDDEDLVRVRGSGSGPVVEEGDPEPIEPNTEDNELHPMNPANSPPIKYNTTNNHVHPATQTASAASNLHRSLFYYLVPIVVIWFGNTVTDWVPLPF